MQCHPSYLPLVPKLLRRVGGAGKEIIRVQEILPCVKFAGRALQWSAGGSINLVRVVTVVSLFGVVRTAAGLLIIT